MFWLENANKYDGIPLNFRQNVTIINLTLELKEKLIVALK